MADEIAPEVEVQEEVKAEGVEVAAPEASVEEVPEAQPEAVEQVEEQPAEEVAVEEVPNARAEFNEFVNAFGMERAAEYYAAGLSLDDAKAAYMDALIAENKQLKGKLAEVETVKPVAAKPDDASDAPVSFTRAQITKMSKDEYARNKQEILKAYAEGRIK